jgi:tripartite-type tricarboxylate transporter receptor subunit TctC
MCPFAESGYPDVKIESWIMLMAPRGLQPAVRSRLHKALAETLADAGVRKALSEQGLEPSYASAEAAATLIETELPLMRATAARANIVAD